MCFSNLTAVTKLLKFSLQVFARQLSMKTMKYKVQYMIFHDWFVNMIPPTDRMSFLDCLLASNITDFLLYQIL